MSQEDQQPVELDYAPRQPQPRSRFLSGGWLTLLIMAIGCGCLLVWLCTPRLVSRPLSPPHACFSSLTFIGKGCEAHALRNEGAFPRSLGVLVSSWGFSPGSLVCPTSGLRYIYIPGQTVSDDPLNVVAYERLGNHDNAGGYVLFLGGDVVWLEPEAHRAAIARTRENLARVSRTPDSHPAQP